MADKPSYWFPAKRYGWGWGPPTTWQGWVVMIVWGLAVVAGIRRFMPLHKAAFGVFMATWLVTLLVICYWKGEPPSWRWGDRSRGRQQR